MSTSPGAGRAVLGPGQAAAWVGEHGAHLIDYAVRHLPPDRAVAAASSALAACRSGPAPLGVTPRGRLLAFLRRECRISPGYRAGYVPDADMPGMPERRLIERAWTIVDPLGAEALRLMYRHELTTEDLVHALSISMEEVPGLTTRTQDLIETLVSGLDSLATAVPPAPTSPRWPSACSPARERSRPPRSSRRPARTCCPTWCGAPCARGRSTSATPSRR